MKRFLKYSWTFFAAAIIFMAVISSIFRSFTPWVEQHKTDVENRLSVLVGQKIVIKSLKTSWYWFQPVLQLEQVTIGTDFNKSFQINKLIIGVNLLKSLWFREFKPGVLFIDKLNLSIKQRNGSWNINGINSVSLEHDDFKFEQLQPILFWLTQQKKIIVKQVSAYIYFENGLVIPVDGLHFAISNTGNSYKVKGMAHLKQTEQTIFKVLGEFVFDPNHLDRLNGAFYISAKDVLIAQWQSLIPQQAVQIDGGKAAFEIWMDLQHGSVTSIQAQMKLKRVAWSLLKNGNSQLVQRFYANLLWKTYKGGWELQGDHVQLRIGEVQWPENQFLVKYNEEQQSQLLFIKHIVLESLFSDAINWPSNMTPLLKMQMHGILDNTQVLIKERENYFNIPSVPLLNSYAAFNQHLPIISTQEYQETDWIHKKEVKYILSGFKNLGWKSNSKYYIPEVENVSGVLNWQPDEGKIEIDSSNTRVLFSNHLKQTISFLNGSFDWKELSDGLRVSIDHLVFNSPEYTLSLQGLINQASISSFGTMHLEMDFSGKHIEQWKSYLPHNLLKPKLYQWIIQDLKHVEKYSGKLLLEGQIKDFPFDHNEGKFLLSSHVSGGVVRANSRWKPLKQVEGDIHLNKRDLSIDLSHALVDGAPIEQIKLLIKNIGNSVEELVITGHAYTPLQKTLNYILHSPLRAKLVNLKILHFFESAYLDLKLNIPLYPTSKSFKVDGSIRFDGNTMTLKQNEKSLTLNQLFGNLYFNEHGVLYSVLNANAFTFPLTVGIESSEKNQTTDFAIQGSASINYLKKWYQIPLAERFQGVIPFDAKIHIAHVINVPNVFQFHSDLRGLSIDLPPPLGKKSDELIPLDMSLQFYSKQKIQLTTLYKNRVSSDLLLNLNNKEDVIQSGVIQFGSAIASNLNNDKLLISGVFKNFSWDKWLMIYQELRYSKNKNNYLNPIAKVDLEFKNAFVSNNKLPDFRVKAANINQDLWLVHFEHNRFNANLEFNLRKPKLSGIINNLQLDNLEFNKFNANLKQEDSDTLRPEYIPDLDLHFNNFSMGLVNLDNITIASQSHNGLFQMNKLRIESPFYAFHADGQWEQHVNKNKTTLHAWFKSSDLAQSFNKLNMNPVVDSKNAYIEFKGFWNKKISELNFAALQGELFLQLKNGRITHLNHDAEGKIDLGKLLSILSLQTIPRRLQLDFSDLSHQGYSFDIFKGNFKVKNGLMHTKNSYLDGPVAFAKMNGELDLVQRNYDLNLKISPHITASLPVVATIAGGPVAGVAAWVATKIINQGMQNISAYSYKISGPWAEPIVQQLRISRKEEAPKRFFSSGKGPIKEEENRLD